jgi:hypothetical protein
MKKRFSKEEKKRKRKIKIAKRDIYGVKANERTTDFSI